MIHNIRTYVPGKRKATDTPGEYAEKTSSNSHANKDDIYRWLTLDGWIIRERALGNAGDGTAKEQQQVAYDSFFMNVGDRKFPKKWVHGVWLLGVYDGMQDTIGSSEFQERAWKRAKTVSDSIDLAAAEEIQEAATAEAKRWLSEQQRSMDGLDGAMAKSAIFTDVDDTVGRTAPEIITTPVMENAQDEIRRGVLDLMQRDAKIKELEEQDDYTARESVRMAKAAASNAASSGAGQGFNFLGQFPIADVVMLVRFCICV